MADKSYSQEGFDDFLNRDANSLDFQLGGQTTQPNSNIGGSVETIVKDGSAFDDLWISKFIRSKNWKPQRTGFYIDGRTGYGEFNDILANNITLIGGTIRFGKTSFNDSVNPGYFISEDGINIGAAGDTTRFKYTLDTGLISFIGDIEASTMTSSSISGTTITGGTITGSLIRTSASGARVEVSDSTDTVDFYNTSNQKVAYLEPYLESDGEGIRITTNGDEADVRSFYKTSTGTAYSMMLTKIDADDYAYFTVTYTNDDIATARILPGHYTSGVLTPLRWAATFIPFGTTLNIGGSAAADKWQNGYFSGTVYSGDFSGTNFYADAGAGIVSGNTGAFNNIETNTYNGSTPLAGTNEYYVATLSGGAVTTKLTFIDGILTSET